MFGSELHRVRHERGLSLRALANRVRYDYSYLSRIESGQRRPPVELARILDRVLDTGGLFHDLLLRPGEAAAPPSEPERASARVRDDTAITDLAELRRRALHDCLVGQSISAASLDDWDMCTLRHAAAAKYREPSVLLADLATDFGELQTALTSCRSVKALRRLTRVAAQLSGLVCLALIKLDQRPAFRRWARTARLAAAEVGDPTTTSWVLAQEAYGHFYAHDVEEALTVSTWAQSVAGPCVGSVLAAALEARAQAVRGDENASRGALARAEEIFSLLNAESVADHSAFGYNEAQLRFHQSNALTHLGDTREAVVAQDRALEVVPLGDFMDRALVRLDRAMCLAQDGDAVGATTCATDGLLALTAEQRRGIITGRAREIFVMLPERERLSSSGRDLHELLNSYQ